MDVTYDKPMELPRPTASKSKGTKRHLSNVEYSRIFDTPNAKLMTQTPKDDRNRDPDFAPNGALSALPDADGDAKNSRKSQNKVHYIFKIIFNIFQATTNSRYEVQVQGIVHH